MRTNLKRFPSNKTGHSRTLKEGSYIFLKPDPQSDDANSKFMYHLLSLSLRTKLFPSLQILTNILLLLHQKRLRKLKEINVKIKRKRQFFNIFLENLKLLSIALFCLLPFISFFFENSWHVRTTFFTGNYIIHTSH